MVPPPHRSRPPRSSPPNRHASTGSDRTAPLGIKILCVIGGLVALFGLFTSFRIMAGGGPFTTIGFLFLVLFAGYAIVLYGLWTVRPWGWTWGMVVFGLGALHDLVTLDVVGLLVSLALLAYLYSKRDVYR